MRRAAMMPAQGRSSAPWKTLAHALRQLKPGDTLYLRGGTYYEKVSLTRSGTAEAPITIARIPASWRCSTAACASSSTIPPTSWEPFNDGAEGEYVSTQTYPDADDRKVPHQFLPGCLGADVGHRGRAAARAGPLRRLDGAAARLSHRGRPAGDERVLARRQEGDARHRRLLRAGAVVQPRDRPHPHPAGAPPARRAWATAAYRGETDPRKLPLVVAVGFGDDVLRISGIKHVRIQGLVLRGATGSPMIHVYGSENIDLDHLTVFGGFPGLLVNASKNIRVTHSAFRGLAAPWTRGRT